MKKLAAADIAFGRVNGPAELAQHPHLRRITVGSPDGPAVLSGARRPARRRAAALWPGARIGEHSAKVRAEFAPKAAKV